MVENTSMTSPERNTLMPLPLGQIRPAGWMLEQLRIQADGLTGHLDEFWPDVARSGWIGGDAEGWERGPYWLDGLIPLAFLLDDERLKEKAHHWIGYILDHQHEDGWFEPAHDRRGHHSGDQPKGPAQNRYELDPWPRFVLLKTFTQYHEVTGDPRVVPAMLKFLRKLDTITDERPLRSWARYRWADAVESISWLYARTGESWLLTLSAKLHAQGFDWSAHFERMSIWDKSLPEERDLSTHVVNNAMGLKAAGVWYRETKDSADRDAVARGIAKLDAFHGQATGVFSGDEHLAGRHPSQGTELCAVVEYMYSLEVLIAILGEAWLADRLEKIAYNALPATISPDMWSHQYVQQVNQVICRVDEDRLYTSNGPDANIFGLEPHFGCCTANMHQGWPKFVSHLWMRTIDDGLTAVAYAPCSIDSQVRDVPVHIDVHTTYPFGETVEIAIRVQEAVAFPLSLRVPEWAEGAQLVIDGGVAEPMTPGGFHCLDRQWSGSTTLSMHLPMHTRFEQRDGGSVAIHRGPLLFAMPIDEEWRKIAGEEPHADWELHPTSPWNHALAIRADDPDGHISFEVSDLTAVPFSPDGAPITGTVESVRLPEWGLAHNAAALPPVSPGKTNAPRETIRLIPYGSTNLRIAQFPVVED